MLIAVSSFGEGLRRVSPLTAPAEACFFFIAQATTTHPASRSPRSIRIALLGRPR
jgi:hypothetical protein